MLNIFLIRHGKTYGNMLGRYIGRTDEGLCEAGIAQLSGGAWPEVEKVYVSPMKRCVETAGIIFTGQAVQMVDELKECDFGDFENKNYQELDGDPNYQRWVDSNGMLPFPGGESQEQFRSRCVQGFEKTVWECADKGYRTAAVVAHGGTIMSILEKYAVPHKEFYFWQAGNGEGYVVELNEELWLENVRQISVLKKIILAEE